MNKYDTLRSLKLARRVAKTGVTLVEVLIVVAIMAMLAAGVAVAVIPKFQEAQRKTAKTSALTIRQAIHSWQMTNNETRCPTLPELLDGKHIDAAADPKDPWGQDFHLQCTSDEVVVTSDGPDKKAGTKDDISVPGGATPTGS